MISQFVLYDTQALHDMISHFCFYDAQRIHHVNYSVIEQYGK